MATTDETCPEGNLKVWDIRDFENIQLVSHYQPAEQAEIITSVHNAKWVGNLIFMSYYKLGLRVVDVQDPSQPREIARFGTASAEELGDSFCLFGAWGVDAEAAADGTRIYISDIRNGLWVFRLSVARRQRLVRR